MVRRGTGVSNCPFSASGVRLVANLCSAWQAPPSKILEEDAGLVMAILASVGERRETRGGVPSADNAALNDLAEMMDD